MLYTMDGANNINLFGVKEVAILMKGTICLRSHVEVKHEIGQHPGRLFCHGHRITAQIAMPRVN